MIAAAVLSMGIVTQNQVALRAAPRDSAPQQAVLWAGEVLEIRGERRGYLQVYDHRRERAGFVRANQAQRHALTADEAPELLSVVRFLRDTPGAETLGISYAAAYLKAVPAASLTAEPFDALGTMADRLARRASVNQSGTAQATLAAHLEVAATFGLGMRNFERDGATQICYDGEMFRQVLAMPSALPPERARAALALTRAECVDPALGPSATYALQLRYADMLDAVPSTDLPPTLLNQLHLRRAGLDASIAFGSARRGASPQAVGQRAVDELARVNVVELTDDDQSEYAVAAVRVGASRWAAEPDAARPGALAIRTEPGAAGETCVVLVDTRKPAAAPLARRCTYGTVWIASARSDAAGHALTLAVQPLEGWREMWVFRLLAGEWSTDVLVPGSDRPELGYIEFAGWVPGGQSLLVAREYINGGQPHRRFEQLRLSTLVSERGSSTPDMLPALGRWQDPAWKRMTVALR